MNTPQWLTAWSENKNILRSGLAGIAMGILAANPAYSDWSNNNGFITNEELQQIGEENDQTYQEAKDNIAEIRENIAATRKMNKETLQILDDVCDQLRAYKERNPDFEMSPWCDEVQN